jgi:hypothetical protein
MRNRKESPSKWSWPIQGIIPEGTGQNREESQSELQMSQPRYDPSISRMQVYKPYRCANPLVMNDVVRYEAYVAPPNRVRYRAFPVAVFLNFTLRHIRELRIVAPGVDNKQTFLYK